MQLLVYSPKITPRIKYIFNFIFGEVLLCDMQLTSLLETFTNYSGPKFSYADKPVSNELFFKSSELLQKNNIVDQKISFTHFGERKVPFAVQKSALPFDLFAASFYFLTRYEEYLPYTPDQHQRYPAQLSLQYELDILKSPIIDEWCMILKNFLLHKLPDLNFETRKFQFIPTIDIDRAYHFKSSGLLKNAARIVKSLMVWNSEKLTNIINTGLGKTKDPFDTYQFLNAIHNKYNFEAIFFFLLSYKGDKAHDVNIHPNDKALQDLILATSKSAKIGIHPSYASNSNTNKLKEEKELLDTLLGVKTDISRQHYLKVHLPKTYLQLIKAGISHDYTMGHAAEVGFRAGTCTPFYWYDLQLDKQSHLKVHPFAVMDSTLQKYLKVNPTEAIVLIEELLNNVKMVGGTFYSLWHNESLSETGHWKGWTKVYEKMLAMAATP